MKCWQAAMDGKTPALYCGRVSQLSLQVEVRAFHFSSAWSIPTSLSPLLKISIFYISGVSIITI